MFSRLNSFIRCNGIQLLCHGGIENSSPQVSESDLDDLVEAMKTEVGWFALGIWYGKSETCGRRILE